MTDATNTSVVRHIEQDLTKVSLLLLGSLVMVMCGVWLVLGDFTNTRRGLLAPYVGWLGIAVFGVLSLFSMHFLIKPTSVVLAPEGILVTRLRRVFVPWAGVTQVREVLSRKQKFVELVLAPGVSGKPSPSMFSGFTGRGQEAKKLAVSAATLNVSHEELLRLILAFFGAYRSSGLAAGASDAR